MNGPHAVLPFSRLFRRLLGVILFLLRCQLRLIELRLFQRDREIFHAAVPRPNAIQCVFPRPEAQIDIVSADYLCPDRRVSQRSGAAPEVQLELHQTVMLMVKRELDVLLCDCGCGAFRQLPLQGLGLVQRTFPLIHSEALHTRVFGRFDAMGRTVDAFASAASTMRACSS